MPAFAPPVCPSICCHLRLSPVSLTFHFDNG